MAKPKASPKKRKAAQELAGGYRTMDIRLPQELAPAVAALSRHARDASNTATYMLRQIRLAHAFDKQSQSSLRRTDEEMGEELAKSSGLCLTHFDGVLEKLQAERAAKGSAKSTGRLGPSVPKLMSILLEPTALERALRTWPDGLDPKGRPAFSRIPFAIARHAGKAVADSHSAWLAATASFDASSGAGRPRAPGYSKDHRKPFGMDWSVRQPLPDLSELELYSDKDAGILLTPSEAAAWRNFDVRKLVADALASRWKEKPAWMDRAPSLENAMSLRFTPGRPGRPPRLSVSVALPPQAPPAGSFMASLRGEMPSMWRRKRSGPPAGFDAWMAEICAAQSWGATRSACPEKRYAFVSKYFEACFVDFGATNLATVAFSDGSPGAVLSAREFERKVGGLDARLDARLSKLATAEQRTLQARQADLAAQEPPSGLSGEDSRKLRELMAAVHADPGVLGLRELRREAVLAHAHGLACWIADRAVDAKAAFVVVGRNPGWKTESGMGSEQNRRFHRIPHAKMISLLREKLAARGIALVLAEESHTSRVSFAHSDPLPVHPAQAKIAKAAASKLAKILAKAEPKIAKAPQPQAARLSEAAAPPKSSNPFLKKSSREIDRRHDTKGPLAPQTAEREASGTRGGGKGRSWYAWGIAPASGSKPKRKKAAPPSKRTGMHADLNGAFNIGRKACPRFACHPGLSLAFRVWGFQRGGGWARVESARALA